MEYASARMPYSNVPATEAKALPSVIKSALSPCLIFSRNPRTLVQLVVQALSPSSGRGDGSGMVAAMINAATLAFLNAGSVPMQGIICAVAVGRRVGGELVVDPSGEEEEVEAAGCFAFFVTHNLSHQETAASCVHTS
jgi:exosome complex component RRP46